MTDPSAVPPTELAEECKRLRMAYGSAVVHATAHTTTPGTLDALVATERALDAAIDRLAALAPSASLGVPERRLPEGLIDALIGSERPPASPSVPPTQITGLSHHDAESGAGKAAWVITAPDGRQWTGESPVRAAAAAQRDTINPRVALQRIWAIVEDDRREATAAMREDSQFLRYFAASLTYNDTTAEGEAKHRLHEIAMRIATGYYDPPAEHGTELTPAGATARTEGER